MSSYLVFEITGTGKPEDRSANEQHAVKMIQRASRDIDRANIECCQILDVKTDVKFERLIRVSKGAP